MRGTLVVAVVAAVVWAAPAAARPTCVYRQPPPVEASFERTSYRAGQVAVLDVRAPQAPLIEVQILRVAPEIHRVDRPDLVDGVPITAAHSYVWGPDRHQVWIGLGATWSSGVYFARVQQPDGRVAFAPLVLRPAQLGASRAAVVIPTYTWQAYDFRRLGSWYSCPRIRSVQLGRPYLARGVPPHFRDYDAQFLQWLVFTHKDADYLTDEDLERLGGGQLRRLYDLVVFEGHEEYVTGHNYDTVTRYRDLGGNLMFLSANNFFRHVVVRGRRMTLVGLWRYDGRPEAALVGAQYTGRAGNRPYRVAGAQPVPWLFAGTGLATGDAIRGAFGIEIDARAPSSPQGTVVVARIPGEPAEMTYYAWHGAQVFAAGALDFGGSAEIEPIATMLENLWARFTPHSALLG